MNELRSFEQRLGLWLDEGPQSAPQDLLGEVLDAAAAIPHARRVGPWRLPPWLASPDAAPRATARQAGLLLAVAALLVIAIGALMTIGRPAIPLPTPTATPGPTPTRLPASTAIAAGCLIEHAPRPDAAPSWDPSAFAGWIAFTSTRQTVDEVLVFDPANLDTIRVLATDFGRHPIQWAPDGSALLMFGPFSSPDVPPGLMLYDANGTVTTITDRGTGAFSPDGRLISFSVPGEGLCLSDADGSNHRTLAADASAPYVESTAWSPDGSRLVFIDLVEESAAHGHEAVGLSFIDSDGSNLQQLVVNLGTDVAPEGLTWSPDGSTLAFSMYDAGGPNVFLIDADGTNLRRLLSVGPTDRPQWSPDGTRIAYAFLGALSTIKPDGTDYHPVTGVDPSNAPGSTRVLPDGPFAWDRRAT